jgi:hypothetical protein
MSPGRNLSIFAIGVTMNGGWDGNIQSTLPNSLIQRAASSGILFMQEIVCPVEILTEVQVSGCESL